MARCRRFLSIFNLPIFYMLLSSFASFVKSHTKFLIFLFSLKFSLFRKLSQAMFVKMRQMFVPTLAECHPFSFISLSAMYNNAWHAGIHTLFIHIPVVEVPIPVFLIATQPSKKNLLGCWTGRSEPMPSQLYIKLSHYQLSVLHPALHPWKSFVYLRLYGAIWPKAKQQSQIL